MMRRSIKTAAAVAIAWAALAAPPAQAQHGHGGGHASHPGPMRGYTGAPPFRGPMRLDDRYRHDHYYPATGVGVRILPSRAVNVPYLGVNWFFHGGVWFRPAGGAFVVAAPPLGIVVPMLPPAYVSLWIGDQPYYYANGTYYSQVPNGYTVVAQPSGADTARAVPVPAAPAPTLAVYPRNGQSNPQTEADRVACNDWANTQPGAAGDAEQFQRGFAACMDGRGYSVR